MRLLLLILQTKKMSRAKKMVEAACKRSRQNDIIFFTKESIDNMSVILAADSSTSEAIPEVIMRIDPLADDAAISNAVTEVIMKIPPLADGAAIFDAVTEVIMEIQSLADVALTSCSRALTEESRKWNQ
ncbi:unnamed protein product [Diatraea saccharalis]|uniref:Uncharacterized protein n=1 Tax=Diatraea saccharalis TaxID=40085 RepID=A0A9N9R7B4_9NEOP|nr:unnamed protein product [Diatraea saccharalis]